MKKPTPRPGALHTPSMKSQHKMVAAHTKPAPPQPVSPVAWVWLGFIMIFSVLCLVAVGKQGQRKGQSFWYGFAFALFTSPIVASIFIAFLRPTDLAEEETGVGTWWWRIMLVLTYLAPLVYLVGLILLILFLLHVSFPGSKWLPQLQAG